MRSSFLKRLTAGGGALAVALTGAVVVTASPASAQPVVTDYGYAGTAFGTRVISNSASLNTGRLAHAWVSCTRMAGLNGDNRPNAANYLAAADAPQNNPFVQLGAMENANRTFRNKDKNLYGVTSVAKLASVTLSGPADGDMPGPVFRLEGLKTKSTAFAKKGVFDADSTFTSANLTLDLPSIDPAVDGPLGDLIAAVEEGIGTVLATLGENGGEIEIPGLGLVRQGAEDTSIRQNVATARAYALVVDLYGQDGVAGGEDDSTIILGKTRARIMRDLPAGVMNGYGYGLDVKLADGLAKIGETGIQPLDCRGTNGETVSARVPPAQDLLEGMLDVGALEGIVNGLQRNDGTGRAWTRGEVGSLDIGEGDARVQMTAIVGQANVRKKESGKIVRNIDGSGIGSLTIGGESFSADQIPTDPIEVPGLGLIEFNVTKLMKKGVRVTAVRITLNPGEAGETVINLGNARAFIHPY